MSKSRAEHVRSASKTLRRLGPLAPLPIPTGKLRRLQAVVVFGGSFDPPHERHTHIATIARDRLYGDAAWLLFVPAARSPLKAAGPIASEEHRLRMLEIAIQGQSACSIWTDEIDRSKPPGPRQVPMPSYSLDTIRRLRRIIPRHLEIRLMLGSDQAVSFHRWREPRRILASARPLVLLRDPIETNCALYDALARTGYWSTDELRMWSESVAPTPVLAGASTDLRSVLASGNRANRGPAGLHPKVWKYIVRHGLYTRDRRPASR